MEKSSLKNYFIVSFIILLGFLLLFFGINFLQGNTTGKKSIYHAIFTSIGTLSKGDPVKISGVTLGEVIRTELWNGQVRVTFQLKISFKNEETKQIHLLKIPINSKISIQNIGLMGEREINIILGSSTQYLLPGSMFQTPGNFSSGIAEVMGNAGKLLFQAKQSLTQISQDSKILFDTLNSTLSTFNSTIQIINNLHSPIQEITQNFKSLTSNLSIIANSLNDSTFLKHIKNITKNIDSIVTRINDAKKFKIDVDFL